MKCRMVVWGVLMVTAAFSKQYQDEASAYRTFTAGGREIAAQVVSVDISRGTVMLELENKLRKKVNIAIFSAKDQAHIQECALIQDFQSSRFKIEMEKVAVGKRREDPQSGVRREVESLRYDIKVTNGTGLEMKGLVIAYNIFLEQEHVGDGENKTKRYFVDGTIEMDPLPPRAKKVVSSEVYEIYSQKLAGGYDGYTSGAPTHQSGKSKGIWVKARLKTPSGMTAERDVCLPKNTNTIFGWNKPGDKD